jgi:hypothetical protein
MWLTCVPSCRLVTNQRDPPTHFQGCMASDSPTAEPALGTMRSCQRGWIARVRDHAALSLSSSPPRRSPERKQGTYGRPARHYFRHWGCDAGSGLSSCGRLACGDQPRRQSQRAEPEAPVQASLNNILHPQLAEPLGV